MKPQKPITPNMKEKANALYKYMYKAYPRYCSKEELAEVIGCKNERSVRDVIALLSTRTAVISNSTQSGYKLAITLSDVEEARHTWAELSSRMEELEKRIKPIIKFIDKAKEKELQKGVQANG